jgi:hypothetical protein
MLILPVLLWGRGIVGERLGDLQERFIRGDQHQSSIAQDPQLEIPLLSLVWLLTHWIK